MTFCEIDRIDALFRRDHGYLPHGFAALPLPFVAQRLLAGRLPGSSTSAGKSDASSNGARLSASTASSMDLTCRNQKPTMSSLVSAKGPSVTMRCCPEPDPLALRARLQTFAGEHHASLYQLLKELPHGRKGFLGR
jgi:hypothetical protein